MDTVFISIFVIHKLWNISIVMKISLVPQGRLLFLLPQNCNLHFCSPFQLPLEGKQFATLSIHDQFESKSYWGIMRHHLNLYFFSRSCEPILMEENYYLREKRKEGHLTDDDDFGVLSVRTLRSVIVFTMIIWSLTFSKPVSKRDIISDGRKGYIYWSRNLTGNNKKIFRKEDSHDKVGRKF